MALFIYIHGDAASDGVHVLHDLVGHVVLELWELRMQSGREAVHAGSRGVHGLLQLLVVFASLLRPIRRLGRVGLNGVQQNIRRLRDVEDAILFHLVLRVGDPGVPKGFSSTIVLKQ